MPRYLDEAFKGTSIRYTFENDYIVLTKQATPSAPQQTGSVSGIIVDDLGDPVIGTNVMQKGTTNGTVTDLDGNFTLSLTGADPVVVVTYIGYIPQEVPVNGQSTLHIRLVEDTQRLEEVVVIGYGVQKKANVTGSVAHISADAIQSRSVASVSAALAGQVPGVTVIQTSGAPGLQTGSVTIRGKNTINAGSPLVIVDGVPGSMNTIDPQDIESLTILKDAASSAIYGVQAANGVILITTKKGNKGSKARINYSGSVSVVSPVTNLKFLGAGDYAMLYNEAVKNENPNAILPYTDEDIEKYRNGTYPDTDWYKETFKSAAAETYHNLSINGGTERTNYNASIGYSNQNGFVSEEGYERFTVRSVIESQVNNWLTAGLNVNGYRGTRNTGWDSYTGLRQYANRLAPVYPVYNEDGSYFYTGNENPVAHRGNTGYRKYMNQEVNASAYVTLAPLPGLSVKTIFSVRNLTTRESAFKAGLTYGSEDSAYSTVREGYKKFYDRNWYNTQVLVNYYKSFGKHSLTALAAFEQNEYLYRYTEVTRKGDGNDELGDSLNSLDKASQTNDDTGYDVARRAYFGRIQYDYNDKYLFEFNLRADASSIFPKDNRWGYFPSVSVGWRITEEQFVKEAGLSWLSNLKLRGGWGKTGNEELKADDVYPAVATYAYDSYMYNNSLYMTAKDSRYVNNKLKWATVNSYEAAIEASFLNHQYGFELAAYKKETDGMLLYLPVQGILGMSAPAQNAGKVQNTGFDLSLFHNKRINKDLSYAVNVNLSYLKNKITDMAGTDGENPDNSKQWFIEGYAVGSFYGYKAIGLFNSEEELAKAAKRTGTEQLGDIRYMDLDKSGNIDAADRMVIGKDFPSWTTGLNMTLFYKNFDFSMFWQGAFDVQGYFENEAAYAFFNSGKVLERHLDRWTPTNPNASYPRITKDTQVNYSVSSYWLENTSYMRLKNITLGYNFPQRITDSLGIERLNVYVAGDNLITISGLDGLDPEQNSTRGNYYPNLKKVSFGVRVTF